MAVTSGRVNSATSKNSNFYLAWQIDGDQSIAGNYTKVKWQAGAHVSNGNKWYSNAIKINSCYIDGVKVFDGGTWSNITTNGDHQLASGTATIYHNTDGTKTFTASINGKYYSYSAVSGSDDFELPTIPRYANITSFSVSKRDETSVQYNFTADASLDYVWYSTDNGATWHDLPNSNIVSGLSPNTGYNFKVRVRRTDSQLTTDSDTYYQETYDYPKPTSATDFVIGSGGCVVGLYNPLGRNVTLQILQVGTDTVLGTYTGTYAGNVGAEFNTADAISRQYASIPNSNSGTYYAKVTYGNVVKTYGNKTYYTNVNECSPSFSNFNVKDNNSSVVAVTGNNQIFVKGKSTLYVTIPSANKMTTQKSATPSSYALSCDTLNSTANYSSSDVNVNMGTLVNSGTLRVNVRAYDSRSNSALAYKDITVYDYAKPVINVSATRLNNFENETTIKISGTYTRLTINNTDKNTITNVKYRYRETGGTWSGWTTLTTSVVSGRFTCNDVILSLDNTKSFEFEVQATDKLDTTSKPASVGIGQAIFFVSSNNKACYINGQEIIMYDVVDTW